LPEEPTSAETGTESGTDRIADRYGRARKKPRTKLKRWQAWTFTAVALVASGVAAYIGYQNLAGAPIEAQRIGYEERPNNAVEITVDVTRDDPAREAVCIVRARNLSGQESGRKEILVPPEQGRMSTVIQSIGRPVTADVYGCSYDIPEYLSSP